MALEPTDHDPRELIRALRKECAEEVANDERKEAFITEWTSTCPADVPSDFVKKVAEIVWNFQQRLEKLENSHRDIIL